jgi:3-methyladenine DNA glycosylase AlkD
MAAGYGRVVLRSAPQELADEVDALLCALAVPTTQSIRRIRREFSRGVRSWTGEEVVAAALALVERHRWVAYELAYHHPSGSSQLDATTVQHLGAGLDSWGAVDAFGRYISGPAWQQDIVSDAFIQGWAASPDRWWRRAALVSTVPLNLRVSGGTGDTNRTLDICARLIDDRDDMVVKGLSWALRELVTWDPDAVRRFVADHDDRIAARVRREVTSKLETGLKQRRR